jgi:hypothetical protein
LKKNSGSKKRRQAGSRLATEKLAKPGLLRQHLAEGLDQEAGVDRGL